jgi:predicted nucleotidyltransferase
MIKELVRIKFGSHLYGTNTPESDTDYKTVFIPETRDILLQKAPRTLQSGPKKADGEKNKPEDVDIEGFSLHQYLKLLSEGQTVAIDMLFAPLWAIENKADPIWTYLFENREKVCNKKAASFVGYCRTQANKYGIKGSRISAVRAVVSFLEIYIKFFGSSTKLEQIKEEINGLIQDEKSPHIKVIYIENRYGSVAHLECCNRKVPFFATLKTALDVYSKILTNYGDRALLAEANLGIDWKALSHAVRVGREALEFLSDCNIIFPRPEAEHLLKIKKGLLPYTEVAEEIEELLTAVESAENLSPLPIKSDQKWIDNFIVEIYRKTVMEKI